MLHAAAYFQLRDEGRYGTASGILEAERYHRMVMSIASRSFSMENRVPFVFILDEMTTFKVRDFEKLPSVLREYGAAFLLLTQSEASWRNCTANWTGRPLRRISEISSWAAHRMWRH